MEIVRNAGIVLAGAALAAYHTECAPAVRAEVMCKVGEDSSKLIEQAVKDAQELSPPNPDEVKTVTDQHRELFK